MKPAGRSAHVVDRLRNIYIHRAGRRRMPSIALDIADGWQIAGSLANLDRNPDAETIFANGNARLFGIPLSWQP